MNLTCANDRINQVAKSPYHQKSGHLRGEPIGLELKANRNVQQMRIKCQRLICTELDEQAGRIVA
jgi:hypothetical protein